jgi:hypothetical protein
LPKYHQRASQLDPIAILQGLNFAHRLTVNSARGFVGQMMQDVSTWRRFDFRMLPGDGGVAEDADLGALV